jgi:uncharacterized membrane protein HdeD (DUF308 family)
MFFTVALDILVILYVLSRQRMIRAVPRQLHLRVPVVLGVIGFFELINYTGSHHVSSTDYDWVIGTLVIGAGVLGAVRAFTVKLWTANNWVVRQGTALTFVLWLVSLGLHFVGDEGANHAGAGNFASTTLLLYVAVTLAVQTYVVHRRAVPLWNELGPDAGQRLQVNFGQFPGGAGAFFTNFTRGAGPSPGQRFPQNDPTIIDAEVVDDDDEGDQGRPQLR